MKVGGEGDDRGWDGWMASPTQWTWVWVNSRSWWWTERPGVLQSMGSQRVRHDWVTELNWTCLHSFLLFTKITSLRVTQGLLFWHSSICLQGFILLSIHLEFCPIPHLLLKNFGSPFSFLFFLFNVILTYFILNFQVCHQQLSHRTILLLYKSIFYNDLFSSLWRRLPKCSSESSLPFWVQVLGVLYSKCLKQNSSSNITSHISLLL